MSIGAVFNSVEHAYAWGVQELSRGAHAVAHVLQIVQASEQPTEAVTALIFPQALIAERAAYGILGLVIKAIEDAGLAADANGVNLQLDAQAVADVRGIIPAVKAQLGQVAVK